jgi:hypothetical protein
MRRGPGEQVGEVLLETSALDSEGPVETPQRRALARRGPGLEPPKHLVGRGAVPHGAEERPERCETPVEGLATSVPGSQSPPVSDRAERPVQVVDLLRGEPPRSAGC